MADDDEMIYGPWRFVREELSTTSRFPAVVNGLGGVVEYGCVVLHHTRERRAVWRFVGYEERMVTS